MSCTRCFFCSILILCRTLNIVLRRATVWVQYLQSIIHEIQNKTPYLETTSRRPFMGAERHINDKNFGRFCHEFGIGILYEMLQITLEFHENQPGDGHNLHQAYVNFYSYLNLGNYVRNIWQVLKCGAGEGLEKINWTDRVRNEVLQKVKEERNILDTAKRIKANWIGHILHRNCHLRRLRHVIEGKVESRLEVTGRRGKSCKQLLYHRKENGGY